LKNRRSLISGLLSMLLR